MIQLELHSLQASNIHQQAVCLAAVMGMFHLSVLYSLASTGLRRATVCTAAPAEYMVCWISTYTFMVFWDHYH